FRGRRPALMLMRRSTAPMRHGRHQKKAQCRRKEQFCLTVQSTAARSELLMPWGKDRSRQHASCCDSDKGSRTETTTMLARRLEADPLLATCCSTTNRPGLIRAEL